jgi:hypothetical protein
MLVAVRDASPRRQRGNPRPTQTRGGWHHDALAGATRLTVCSRQPVLARSDPRGVGRSRHTYGRSCVVSRSLAGALLPGDEPFAQALVLCILAGLIWQFVLTLILTRRELGTLRFSRVREALWLLSPRDPRTGRVGGSPTGYPSRPRWAVYLCPSEPADARV